MPRGGSTHLGVWEVRGQPLASYSIGNMQGSCFSATRTSSPPTGVGDRAVSVLHSAHILADWKNKGF